jgi:hypothetical protein
VEYRPVRISDLIRDINNDLYLPAIQREFVWEPKNVERLFDSVMSDFPIGSFLFWRLKSEKRDQWPIYQFIQDFDEESPHNLEAGLAGNTRDIRLVLDGQQRITALYIGLRGSYRFFRYRWRRTRLYLNLLKSPVPNEDNPEELTYGFAFRETDLPDDPKTELWYPVNRILDFPNDAEDAKADIKSKVIAFSEEQRDCANRLVGKLHTCVHTKLVGNYYEETDQNPEKVLQEFVRANSGGVKLEYSDLLLATATASWKRDARKEIHEFTDSINDIGTGYSFGKDLVLKASLYMTGDLPIQYKVKNFTKPNLEKIEANWDQITASITTAVRLVSRFGFNSKNIVAPFVLLPIALYLLKRSKTSFDKSSEAQDAAAQIEIRRWFIFATLKNAFGASTDTTLNRSRDILKSCGPHSDFPSDELYKMLGIEPKLNESEIEQTIKSKYQGRYTYLVLSLLYPDRDWKDAVFHEDHIFPKSEFQVVKLRKRGFEESKIGAYLECFNSLGNLELLTDSDNLSKNAIPFENWIQTRDPEFRKRHLIPDMAGYGIDSFLDFMQARSMLITNRLRAL